MGIAGLTTFIKDNADVLLEPFELRDTPVVIDGCSLAHIILSSRPRHEVDYGGDYDSLYAAIKKYFLNLRECNVKPIVLFDGPSDENKEVTALKRLKEKMKILTEYRDLKSREYSRQLCPLHLISVFRNVLNDLRVAHSSCLHEADGVVASVAKALKCPVMSNDSDFYLYGVPFIPLQYASTMVTRDPGEMPYISCQIYHKDGLLDMFDGVERECLPLIASILGNDYVSANIFTKFLNHVPCRKSGKSHGSSYVTAADKVRSVFKWFKNETSESARKIIESHVGKRNIQRMNWSFEESAKVYNGDIDLCNLSEVVRHAMRKRGLQGSDGSYADGSRESVFKRFPVSCQRNFLITGNNILLNIAHSKYMNMPVIIEDVAESSVHTTSLPLIRVLQDMVESWTGEKRTLRLRMRKTGETSVKTINLSGSGKVRYDRENWEGATVSERRDLLCDILELTDDDKDSLRVFDGGWTLYAMCIIYWARRNVGIGAHYVRSLLASAIVCQMRGKGGRSNKRKSKKTDTEAGVVSRLISRISQVEKSKLIKRTSPSRRWTALETVPFAAFIIHKFNSFQSVLKYASVVNDVLERPYPPVEIESMFSGSLVYFFLVQGKIDPGLGVRVNEESTPETAEVLRAVTEPLVHCIPLSDTPLEPIIPGRKRK